MSKGRKTGGGREADDPDEVLWKRITAEVRPLRSRAKSAPAPVDPSGQARTPPPKTLAPIPKPPLPKVRPTTASEATLAHGIAAGLDKRTLARLRRGQITIEAEIDLHGSTQDEAHQALEGFLARSHAIGRRCVLVITGKGLRADGGEGVLRNAVPRWMNEAPNRERILAFTHATPRDGGEGALYVLLRRKRRSGDEIRE